MIDHQNHSLIKMIFLSIKHYKMFNFMCSLIILLILLASLKENKSAFLIIKALSTIVFMAGVYVASENKRSLIILSVLALPWIFSEWFFITSTRTVYLSFFFFVFVTIELLEKIIKTKDVTLDTLYAAVCVYLLLGLIWASLYGILNEFIPGEVFSTGVNGEKLTVNEIIYFSYTTLTTLGYGDIVFISPVGRIMSVLEAIIGHLFIAFLVARLVSIFSHKAFRN